MMYLQCIMTHVMPSIVGVVIFSHFFLYGPSAADATKIC